MTYSDYVIYVDESGDHTLTAIDRDYPVFVLDFCIFRKDNYANVVAPQAQAFKFAHFGHDIVVLHEHEIRKQKPPFVFLKSRDKRDAFMDGLNRLIEQADFTIVAAAIHKERLTQRYAAPGNPYEMALTFCMERAHAFLRDRGQHIRRYDVLKDVWRMERFLAVRPTASAAVLVLTNDPAYWRGPRGESTCDAAFALREGRSVTGLLDWSPHTGAGTKRGREAAIDLKGEYTMRWADYSRIDRPFGEFRFLYLPLARP